MIGYRAWEPGIDEKNNPILKSVTVDYCWESNVVGCKIDSLMQSLPDVYLCSDFKPDDSVGFYAFNDIDEAWLDMCANDAGYIFGEVNGFGKIAIHERGFRSQYSQIFRFLSYIRCTLCDKMANLYFINDNVITVCSECQDSVLPLLKTIRCQYDGKTYIKHLCKKYEVVDLIHYMED
jgi:hypothetical protein